MVFLTLEYAQSGKCEKKQHKQKYTGFLFSNYYHLCLGRFHICTNTCTFLQISVPGPIIQGEAACLYG